MYDSNHVRAWRALRNFETHTVENIAAMTTPRPAASAQPGDSGGPRTGGVGVGGG